jgi:hypothetical protein
MSDFKNVSDFRKCSFKKYPYQDPTYLSFAILFDWYNAEESPLLAGSGDIAKPDTLGPAELFLYELGNAEGTSSQYYKDRFQDLINFKKALKTINDEMPWYWQSLKGLERIKQHDPMNAYMGGDDAKIEIETLESLNLPIAGLMHLYRSAIFDDTKWTYILPINLRKFKMYIYVTEVRSIQTNVSTKMNGIPSKLNKDAISGFPGNFKPTIDSQNENAGIMGTSGRPYFMTGIGYCEFDMTTGTTIFADLSKNPEMATNAITIKYETLEKVEARVLNGIIEESAYATNNVSPAPDSEFFENSVKTPLQLAKEKATGRIVDITGKGIEAAKTLAEDKKREIEQEIRTRTVNRIPSMENVFSNIVKKIDNKTDITQQKRNIGNAIQANVNDNVVGSTIKQGLDMAAIKNLGNVYN